MQESESSFLAHFDRVTWFLFHCSFGGGMIYILFPEIVIFVCDSYRRGIIKSNGAKCGQITLSTTLLLGLVLPV